MNTTRLAIVAIVGSALVAAVLLYYQLVYAGYAELTPEEAGEIQLVSVTTGLPEAIITENVKAIDTVEEGVRLSGAVSFRACFETPHSLAMLSETYQLYDAWEPLTGPGWFECYNAQIVGQALETGEAIAFLGVENFTYGIDRVIAVFPDGRGYVWHQLNPCGAAVFAGEDAPEGCPVINEDSDA